MKTQCPHCKAVIKAPDEYRGKKSICPKCKQQFIIGEPLSVDTNKVHIPKEMHQSNTDKPQKNLPDVAPEISNKNTTSQIYGKTNIHIGTIPEKFRIYLGNDEKILYASNPSSGALVLSLLLPCFFTLSFVTTIFVSGLSLGLFVAIVFAALSILFVFLSWKNRYYMITKTKTFVSQGIFNVGISIVPNKSIQMICINTGIIDRLLGLNTLEVSSAAQGGGINIFAAFSGKKKGTIQFKSIRDVHKVVQFYHTLFE